MQACSSEQEGTGCPGSQILCRLTNFTSNDFIWLYGDIRGSRLNILNRERERGGGEGSGGWGGGGCAGGGGGGYGVSK